MNTGIMLTLVITILFFIATVIFRWWYNSPQRKGRVGEVHVSEQLLSLSSDYHVFNDVVLKTDRGTTQIDHIIVSRYGVFTIETKNYRGEIYGDDNRKEWTQIIVTEVTYSSNWFKTYTYVTKNRFYNPVKQSIGHAIHIKELLNEYSINVVPIVAFTENADLAKVNCRNHVVYDYQLPSLINSYQSVRLADEDVKEIVDIINLNNLRDIVDNKTHVSNLRTAREMEKNKVEAGICPKCGGTMKRRYGRYGSFYGCSNYPNCKYTFNEKA